MNHLIIPAQAVPPFTSKQKIAAMLALPAPQQFFSHAAVAQRAYEIYIQGGCQMGQCEENWRRAELALLAEAQDSFGGIDCGCEEAPAPFDASVPILQFIAPEASKSKNGKGTPPKVKSMTFKVNRLPNS